MSGSVQRALPWLSCLDHTGEKPHPPVGASRVKRRGLRRAFPGSAGPCNTRHRTSTRARWRSSRPAAGRTRCGSNGGALILQPHIRHAGDAGNARVQLSKLLSYVAILPWVRVKHLASGVLGQAARRVGGDWQQKYGHGLDWLETFVDRERYRGSCYRAANWDCVGQTQGRSRQDRDHDRRVPVKDVYLYAVRNGRGR